MDIRENIYYNLIICCVCVCASDRNFLVVKRNKLCYLAPELIRNLSHYHTDENTWHVNFLHTDETDIYAFGYVIDGHGVCMCTCVCVCVSLYVCMRVCVCV